MKLILDTVSLLCRMCIICTFSLLLAFPAAHAQPGGDDLSTLRPGQLKSFGKNALSNGDAASSALYYKAYLDKKPSDYKVAYQYAEALRISKDYHKAEEQYLVAYRMNKEKNAAALFWYATMLRINGDYKKADEFYAQFKKEYHGDDKSEYLKLIKNNAKAAEFADSLLKVPVKVTITHVGAPINTGHVEAAPYFTGDSTIIYSSLKTDLTWFSVDPEDSTSNEPFRKLYTAEMRNGTWTETGELPGPFNSDTEHSTNGTYSFDGNRFYFTRCRRNARNKAICSIYVSRKENGEWSAPESLGDGVNDPEFTSTQPAVAFESTRNREVIYFVSDREGGRGGMDIWYTIYDSRKKVYMRASNAGPKINTAGDETTPYFDKRTNTTYFSSDGWQGIGGLDIFTSNGELKKRTPPKNMGAPLNSSYDDLYYVLNKTTGQTGMFVSNREIKTADGTRSGCCDDLFYFKFLNATRIQLEGKVGDATVADGDSNAIIKGARLTVEIKDPSDTSFIPSTTVFTDRTGKFDMELQPDKDYRITVQKNGFLNEVISVPSSQLTDGKMNLDFMMKAAPTEAIRLNNIYYEFGSATLTPAATAALDSTLLLMLQRNPNLVVEVSSHTDNIGSEADNMNLSQQRAESVVNYLVGKGISKNHLRANGYGESKPIAQNQHPNGSDNPEGRTLNRRTEFRILGQMMPDGKIREQIENF
jgi:OOP family OmpA-OmpF porin